MRSGGAKRNAIWSQDQTGGRPHLQSGENRLFQRATVKAVHPLHGMGGPNPHGESVVDIFRVENGKVVEHWDIIQPIPDTADNANSMF